MVPYLRSVRRICISDLFLASRMIRKSSLGRALRSPRDNNSLTRVFPCNRPLRCNLRRDRKPFQFGESCTSREASCGAGFFPEEGVAGKEKARERGFIAVSDDLERLLRFPFGILQLCPGASGTGDKTGR